MNWSFYSETNGRFLSRHFTSTNRASLKLNTPAGYVAIAGAYDCNSQRVNLETGEVIDDPDMAQAHAQARERDRRKVSARQQIAALELRQARPLRELQIDPGNVEAAQRLAEIERDIAQLRATLTEESR